jgi:hypothetical protein
LFDGLVGVFPLDELFGFQEAQAAFLPDLLDLFD